jgi:hypothetical protein
MKERQTKRKLDGELLACLTLLTLIGLGACHDTASSQLVHKVAITRLARVNGIDKTASTHCREMAAKEKQANKSRRKRKRKKEAEKMIVWSVST